MTLCHSETGAVTPPVNSQLLHLHIGLDAAAELRMHIQLLDGARRLITAAVRELGVEPGSVDTPVAILPETGNPWRLRLDAKAVALEERMLQTAAYILCAYLTGMRDCEVQAMQRGCLTLTRSENGVIIRHRVRSMACKGN
jgi:hypothetical protein